MGWMRNKAVAVVLAIIAVAAIGFVVKSTVVEPTVKMVVKCEKSGEVMTIEVVPTIKPPYENPKTKAKTLYPAVKYVEYKGDKPTDNVKYFILEKEAVPMNWRPSSSN